MSRIIVTLITVLLIFTYVIPEKSAQQLPHGPQIQTTVKAILMPVQDILTKAIGTQVSQLINSIEQWLNNRINGQKIQLEQQVTNQVDNSINHAIPTTPSTTSQ